jgi:hypothetical protein
MYASVRGWVEIDPAQRGAAEEIVQRHDDDHYSGGWAFPARPFNWSLCLFYGGDIRESALPWLREQVTELSAIPPADADGDRPVGLFLITDERGGSTVWQVRDGAVAEQPAPALSWLGA